MKMQRRAWFAVALGWGMLLGPQLEAAFAKKAKSSFSAQVDGKRLKASRRGSQGIYATTSFSVAGQTGVRHGLSRTVTAACLGNLKTLVLPAALDCYGSYIEARRHGSKEWSRPSGLQVAIESFDGTRVVGTLQGALDPTAPHASDPPVTVLGGRFSIILRDAGV